MQEKLQIHTFKHPERSCLLKSVMRAMLEPYLTPSLLTELEWRLQGLVQGCCYDDWHHPVLVRPVNQRATPAHGEGIAAEETVFEAAPRELTGLLQT